MKKSGKIISGVVGLLIVIGIKLGASYYLAEAEIAVSKNQDWPTEFKQSFIKGCATEMQENISDEVKTSLCTCLTEEVEKAHVVSPKYNTFKESESQYNERMSKEIYAYFNSDAGKASSEVCAQKILALTNESAPTNEAKE